ncbi:urease accessory protein UreD [Rhodococcus sp. G-MC3]|uniref:urease accessory protein UreD n=1 Tax=Rhodococcus sp. G-MC3 TaxID=3046209 RepID=UPI0024B94B35|nr:urease accessory protein UreD [Rhodococcus sp. G-MC3]MDJ0394096.1 urease accessory protein UreD [Rhodococcus sp. G-MC3]
MRTELVIEASAHRSPRIIASGGLSGRLTGADTVHLIGTAATPLGGDVMNIRIVVGIGARLVIRSVAASVALPSTLERESCSEWSFDVAADGALDFDPEPMIVAADAVHHTRTLIQFESSATIGFRERVQIGRAGERAGRWYGTMRSDIDGLPHLRHRVELGHGTIGHDTLSAPKSLSSSIRFPDHRGPETAGPGAVRMPLAAGGSLTTCTGDRLDALPLSP